MQVNFDISDEIALIQLDDGKKNAITTEAAAQVLAEIVPAVQAIDAAIATARELARMPARANAENKLAVRRQALEIMAADLNS